MEVLWGPTHVWEHTTMCRVGHLETLNTVASHWFGWHDFARNKQFWVELSSKELHEICVSVTAVQSAQSRRTLLTTRTCLLSLLRRSVLKPIWCWMCSSFAHKKSLSWRNEDSRQYITHVRSFSCCEFSPCILKATVSTEILFSLLGHVCIQCMPYITVSLCIMEESGSTVTGKEILS